jgi:hypothetical protein
MRDPIENAGGKQLYIGMHGTWEHTTLVAPFACASLHIATFTVDKAFGSMFMIRSMRKKIECAGAEEE